MKSLRSRGFTLIELLVVIAIIGLLASIILASLNTAQQKGRDARRVSDLQEIGQSMAAADNGSGGTNITCTAMPSTSSGVAVSTCSVPGQNLSNYKDPSSSSACSSKTASSTCNYTMYETVSSSLTTQNYEVCGYLETGSGSLPAGQISVSASSSGAVVAGCF